jgi:hypothetical protein
VATYLKRDVRQLLAVHDLSQFHRNFGKRLAKTPRLYFLDVGLMAWLLGIRDAATIETTRRAVPCLKPGWCRTHQTALHCRAKRRTIFLALQRGT